MVILDVGKGGGPSGDNHYFAAVNHNSPSEVGVIDGNHGGSTAEADTAILTPSNASAHNVAADPDTLQVFVPWKAQGEGTDCVYGCVKVYKAHGESGHHSSDLD